MTNIKIYKDEDNYTGYVLEGHAEYGEAGKDIVCAGLSLIAQSTLVGLNILDKVKHEAILDGFISVKINNPNKDTNLLMEIFDYVVKDIELQYPNNVKVDYISQNKQNESDLI